MNIFLFYIYQVQVEAVMQRGEEQSACAQIVTDVLDGTVLVIVVLLEFRPIIEMIKLSSLRMD